ncbi:FtsX-like permease family protein [Amedibacterium intestinale]|uniref:FtsX-like permease family protein n=1 Tax=Amedibacterium intestinale TaxID=2583452 RepID=UPI000E49141B|nr:FtsX-like permease family protein [Amedibacterium intestinale]RHO16572.1 hypothetical protein DW220_12680 [Eubacterium sp. AM18-26]RHO23348.1 hypothetical protein DW212_10815 [Eubacterium sp. AM18-10LB-B]RHO25795.1 hypothetical protein DW208_11850 [Erysipelotrichaceae bacterium AM17-60]BBK61487.1 hypothetical protein A9CBEGH2_04270 [Amedibacterium intestinale]
MIKIPSFNFKIINIFITSAETRKKELAILQAIGMTNKQLFKMLLYEGFYYICISSIGTMIIKALLNIIPNTLYYFIYVYPLNSLLLLTILLIFLCTITTMLIYKTSQKNLLVKI